MELIGLHIVYKIVYDFKFAKVSKNIPTAAQ